MAPQPTREDKFSFGLVDLLENGAPGGGPTYDLSGANEGLETAALIAGTPYDELWFESHLLVLVGNIAVGGLNFLEQQLGSPVTNSQPGLTNRRQRYGSRRSKRNVVVADNRHIVRHSQSCSDKALEHADRQ